MQKGCKRHKQFSIRCSRNQEMLILCTRLLHKRHVWEGLVGWVEMCNFHAKRLQKRQQLLQYKRQEGMGRVG